MSQVVKSAGIKWLALLIFAAITSLLAMPALAKDVQGQVDEIGRPLKTVDGGHFAPINPDFIEWRKHHKTDVIDLTDGHGHSTGNIPSMVKLQPVSASSPEIALMQPSLVVPSSYDMRSSRPDKVPPVRNQGSCGFCWAFAACGTLESTLRPTYVIHVSENNLATCNTWGWGSNGGGCTSEAAGTFLSWQGAIDSTDDPFVSGQCTNPCKTGLIDRYHVIGMKRWNSNQAAAVKQAIMTDGAVSNPMSIGATNDTNDTYHAHYAPTARADGVFEDHVICYVGWDDNFPASRFAQTPPGNGAWLIRNSWGTGYEDGGYVWESYYDPAAMDEVAQFFGEPTTDYNALYQYDPAGQTDWYGYGTGIGWFANVFTATVNDHLAAVGFFAPEDNESYTIKIYADPNSGPINTAGPAITQTGTLTNQGYTTVPLTAFFQLVPGHKFSVVVMANAVSTHQPIPLETNRWALPPAGSSGRSYVGSNGTSWTDVTSISSHDMSVCLKAYSQSGPITCDTPTFSPDAGTYYDITNVAVNNTMPDVTMHYTLNGNDPTETDPTVAVGGTVQITQTQTLKAKAFKTGFNPSTTGTAAYSLKVYTPAFGPPAGSYPSGISVAPYTTSPGVTLRYTTTGADPTSSSPVVTGSVSITRNSTLKAIGFKANWTTSDVGSAAYTVTQAMDPFTSKTMPDSYSTRCMGGVVTRTIGDDFYIETTDRISGIRVNLPGHGFTPGMRVGLLGTMQTNLGERYFAATSGWVIGSATITPLLMACSSLGGTDWYYDPISGAGQQGVFGGKGPGNVGLLVKVAGAISPKTPPDPNRFVLDDNSGCPIDCIIPNAVTVNPMWQNVCVTGISGCQSDGTNLNRVMRVATQEDIVPANGASVSGRVTMSPGTAVYARTLETGHNYPNNSNLLWIYYGPAGSSQMRLHFYETATETGKDFVRVRDANENTIQSITGSTPVMNYWSSWVPGSVAKLRFTSDAANSFYGMKADQYECDTTNCPISGATVTLSPGGLTTTTKGDGTYCFDVVPVGNYTVTVSLSGVTFSPPTQSVSLTADQRATGINFTGASAGGLLSGVITRDRYVTQTSLTECPHPYAASYNNTWTVTAPSNAVRMHVHFTELELESGADYLYVKDGDGTTQQTLNQNTATYDTWSNWISGDTIQLNLVTTATGGRFGFQVDKYEYEVLYPLPGVTVSVDPGGLSTVTSKDGNFLFYGLSNQDYTVTPSLTGFSFVPGYRTVTISSPIAQGWVNFAGN